MNNSSGTYIPVKEGRLYYQMSGAGEPIVFIHGFTLDHRMWQPQVAALGRTFQTLTYDVRGFGRSSLPTGPYNHHDDLAALLKALSIESAHIVGLSMGGRIGVNFALEYPGMVLSLTLLDSALDGYADSVDWDVHAGEEGIEQAKRNWLAHDLFAATRRNPMLVQSLEEMVADYSGWHWLHKDPQSPRGTNAKKRLAQIRARTLVLVGELDLSYFRDIAKTLADRIPGAELRILPNVGHMVNMEAADACTALLADHIQPKR